MPEIYHRRKPRGEIAREPPFPAFGATEAWKQEKTFRWQRSSPLRLPIEDPLTMQNKIIAAAAQIDTVVSP
jgi:hypothetical protein